MKVTLIPSSTSAGGVDQNQYLITYLIDDTLAIDAGCLGFYGTPEQQSKIEHVVISHTHADHMASLPIFVENAYQARSRLRDRPRQRRGPRKPEARRLQRPRLARLHRPVDPDGPLPQARRDRVRPAA